MAEQSVSYQTLLAQCAQEKSAALEQLYEKEAPAFLALGTSLLQRTTDAEELTRESFALIWRHANAYAPDIGSAKAWMYSILRFRAQQRLKQSPTLSPFIKVKNSFFIPAQAPKDLLPFQYLDEKSRKMIGLAYLHGYSFAEIAKECHSSISHTQKQIHDALLALAPHYSGWHRPINDEVALLGIYCLGLLRDAHAVLPAQQLLSTDSNAAKDLIQWERIFCALTTCLTPVEPNPRIQQRLFQELGLPLSTPTPVKAPAPRPQQPSASLQAILQKPTTTRFDTPTTVKATPSAPSSPTPPAATTSDQPDKTQATTQPLATDTSAPSTPAPPFSDQTERARFTWKPHYIWLIVAFLVLLAALAWLLAPKSPAIQMVQMSPRAGAVLQAPGQTSTPGWVLSVDPEGHVLLAPQVRTDLHPDQSVQLWTQEPSSTEIRSLGLINPNQPVTIPAEIIGQVHVGQIFEMTIEPKEGSAEPSSSVLFIGRVVNFGEYQAPVQETPTT